MTDTIFAQASGAPPAAIAIVRVSGPGVRAVSGLMLGRLPEPRVATLAVVRDPGTGEPLDRALTLFFPGPASATGEDVLELHLHGGRAVVAAVERAMAGVSGVRIAVPGEFTRRAVANGRLDLLAAEALGELLTAETELHRKAAQAGTSHLGRLVEGWRQRLLALSADVEVAIDQDLAADEVAIREAMCALADEIAAVLDQPAIERLRDGFLVVIGGPPNAGKSTLFNALLRDEAAIVSPYAGTTRDALERTVTMAGVPIRLVDTAGQRAAGEDMIEAIGMARAAALCAEADLLLWLDAGAPPSGVESLRVQTRLDERGDEGWADLCVSGLSGLGIDQLVGRIANRLHGRLPAPGSAMVNVRQRMLLAEGASSLRAAMSQSDLVLTACDLMIARAAFDRLTGRAGLEDLLDDVFSRFCLGK